MAIFMPQSGDSIFKKLIVTQSASVFCQIRIKVRALPEIETINKC